MEGPYLDETGVDQDTSAGRIHNTTDDRCRRRSRVVSRPHTQTYCNSNRRGEPVQDGTSDGHPLVFFAQIEEGKTRANPETLERFYGSNQ